MMGNVLLLFRTNLSRTNDQANDRPAIVTTDNLTIKAFCKPHSELPTAVGPTIHNYLSFHFFLENF